MNLDPVYLGSMAVINGANTVEGVVTVIQKSFMSVMRVSVQYYRIANALI